MFTVVAPSCSTARNAFGAVSKDDAQPHRGGSKRNEGGRVGAMPEARLGRVMGWTRGLTLASMCVLVTVL